MSQQRHTYLSALRTSVIWPLKSEAKDCGHEKSYKTSMLVLCAVRCQSNLFWSRRGLRLTYRAFNVHYLWLHFWRSCSPPDMYRAHCVTVVSVHVIVLPVCMLQYWDAVFRHMQRTPPTISKHIILSTSKLTWSDLYSNLTLSNSYHRFEIL